MDCTEIARIQKKGLKKVEDLLSITSAYAQNPSNLTPEQTQLFAGYKSAIEGYQSMVKEVVIEKSTLEPYLGSMSVKNNQLRFKKRAQYIHFGDQHNFERYAYDFEYRDGKYIAKTISCLKSQMIKAPLLDLKYMLLGYPVEKIGMGDYIKEFDAIIHQLFENYPKIYEFFFKGLRGYHQKRSEPDYQTCRSSSF